MIMLEVVKKGFTKFLPKKLQIAFKKYYYLRLVQSVSEDCFPIIRHIVAPGDRVVDIGANIGSYTNLLSPRAKLLETGET